MKILLTGTTGTIAPHIVDLLKEFNYKLYEISRRESKITKSIVFLEYINKLEISSIKKKVGTLDVIIHCAALTRSTNMNALFKANQKFTKEIVDLGVNLNCKKFIFLSSDLVHCLDSNYGISKKQCEEIIKNSDLKNWTILRLSTFIDLVKENSNSSIGRLIRKSYNHPLILPIAGEFFIYPINPTDIKNVIRDQINHLKSIKSIINLRGDKIMLKDLILKFNPRVKIIRVPKFILLICLLLVTPFRRKIESYSVLKSIYKNTNKV